MNCIVNRLCSLATAIGVVGVLLALAPHFTSEENRPPSRAAIDPEQVPSKEELKLGWSRSPLVHYRSEIAFTEEDGKLIRHETRELRVGWASLSSMTLALGALFLWAGGAIHFGPRPSS